MRLEQVFSLEPYLGSHALRDIAVDAIARWQAERLPDGVGPTSVRKSLVLLSGILQTAVQAEHLTVNPARMVRKAPLPIGPRSVRWHGRLAKLSAPRPGPRVIDDDHAG